MQPEIWSIGIYQGKSPLQLAAPSGFTNPLLTRQDVSDVRAGFVADPFLLRRDGIWHLFFEVWNADRQLGEIGLATSRDAIRWRYRQIVLREPFHLSYPCVFSWKDETFMIPETLNLGVIQLYRAIDFPCRWRRDSALLPGALADPTPFRFRGRWWMLACPRPYQNDSLQLFHARSLHGPWQEHPASPLIRNDPRRARPAGRVIPWQGGLLRYAQDCLPRYGSSVRAFRIGTLTPNQFEETEVDASPLAGIGAQPWNRSGMHHLDAHRLADGSWIASVDGFQGVSN